MDEIIGSEAMESVLETSVCDYLALHPRIEINLASLTEQLRVVAAECIDGGI